MVIEELLQTEKNYLHDLEHVILVRYSFEIVLKCCFVILGCVHLIFYYSQFAIHTESLFVKGNCFIYHCPSWSFWIRNFNFYVRFCLPQQKSFAPHTWSTSRICFWLQFSFFLFCNSHGTCHCSNTLLFPSKFMWQICFAYRFESTFSNISLFSIHNLIWEHLELRISKSSHKHLVVIIL